MSPVKKSSTSNKKSSPLNVIVIIALIASVVGVFVSYSLLKEDVYSTAETLFRYFPERFGVIPAATWAGALRLGIFVSVVQLVAGAIAFQKGNATWARISAGLLFAITLPFDSWTDVVFRSGALTGDITVAVITTFMFYTIGSEVLQTLSWIIILSSWRQGIREIMRAAALVKAGLSTIKEDWTTLSRNANASERRTMEKPATMNVSDEDEDEDDDEEPAPKRKPEEKPVSKPPRTSASSSMPSSLPRLNNGLGIDIPTAEPAYAKPTPRPRVDPLLMRASDLLPPKKTEIPNEPTYHPISYEALNEGMEEIFTAPRSQGTLKFE